jgi:hypothetical protein
MARGFAAGAAAKLLDDGPSGAREFKQNRCLVELIALQVR